MQLLQRAGNGTTSPGQSPKEYNTLDNCAIALNKNHKQELDKAQKELKGYIGKILPGPPQQKPGSGMEPSRA